jgi:hypothetical protein
VDDPVCRVPGTGCPTLVARPARDRVGVNNPACPTLVRKPDRAGRHPISVPSVSPESPRNPRKINTSGRLRSLQSDKSPVAGTDRYLRP